MRNRIPHKRKPVLIWQTRGVNEGAPVYLNPVKDSGETKFPENKKEQFKNIFKKQN